MPSLNDYHLEDRLRLLLQGPPGSTKTSLAFQFPGAWIIDLDHNLGGPLRFCRQNNIPLPLGYDVVDMENGKFVEKINRWMVLERILLRLQEDPKVQTIVFDSGTILSDMLITETLRMQNKKAISDYKDGRQFWGFYAIEGKRLMSIITSMRKHIVMTIHERTDVDSEGKVVYPVKLTWPGQVGEYLSLFFTDNWRVQLEKVLGSGIGNNPAKYNQVIYTLPTYQYALKNSLLLPEKFVFDWNLIQKKLDDKVAKAA